MENKKNKVETVEGKSSHECARPEESFIEALRDALRHAREPNEHFERVNLRLVSVEIEHGGFIPTSTTKVILEIKDV